ncbi:MAG TPA: hypothetical protein VF883_17380 [Thermoanaerobaculia bacterium]|jgi:hypothetical protein
MKSIRWMSMLVVLAALAVPAAAEDWKLGTAKECGASGSDLKCVVSNNGFSGDTAVLIVTTKLPLVGFSYSGWHSTCGSSGGAVEVRRYDESAAGARIEIDVLDAGSNITCRELFISACTFNGTGVPCSSVVSAVAQTYVGNRQ